MFDLASVWIFLLIPVLTTIILLTYFKQKTKWWELLVVWGGTILIIALAQITTEKVYTSDTEYWGFNAVHAVYDEPFQYWDTCTEEYECGEECSRDSQGNEHCTTKYCTRTYPCKEWGGDNAWVVTQTGKEISISRGHFEYLEKKYWNNSTFVELHREKEYDIIQDGDRRISYWPKTWETSDPISEKHMYENRTLYSSIMEFRNITEEEKKQYALYDYPNIRNPYSLQVILSRNSYPNSNKYFMYLNGIYGPRNKVRIWVLIFNNQPREAALFQKDYWKNGNKNEFIICIGTDKDNNVTWGNVISWTEKETLKVEFRDFIEQNLKIVSDESLLTLCKYTEENIKFFVKPEFTEKFKHLAVQPSTTAMVIIGIIILLINGGIVTWIVLNQFEE